ncbi:Imm53 family immunity protein [Amycolatopsis magusensis]|uniref:Elongation factor P hydroxylase n=1 Tax=Amycolatopsis magusensis TaxID=882444 RepID=A0ABS4PTB2_9PSEU|nr:Imm53 family immunity protein [Amycolatopsis magusensis]MBP2182672.1 elongation factor P hydroxylase [Amycolatopsis magusensis]
MSDVSPFQFLQDWYADQCNGDWEHEFGIRMGTLDNPGWWFEVDLVDTDLEQRVLAKTSAEPGPGRWVWAESDGQKFSSSCDLSSLDGALRLFREFVESGQADERRKVFR